MDVLLNYFIPFIFVLTVIVFVHEFGHYFSARRHGVKVDKFSIGFGPELFGWTDSHGTRWRVSAIPLGGYVMMHGDANEASVPDVDAAKHMKEDEKKHSLFHKTVWQRMEVSAAGPIANFIFSIVVLSFLYTFVGQRVPAITPSVGYVISGTPAEAAGLKAGDIITRVGEQKVTTFDNLVETLQKFPKKENIPFTVKRDQQELALSITPDYTEGIARIGVARGIERVQRGFFESWGYAATDTYNVIAMTLKGIGQMIVGTRSVEGLSGPIGIAKMTGQMANGGIEALIWFMAFLSINLGLINLFPVPMLDGGHLAFYLIEAVRGKPVGPKAQEAAFRVGFFILVSLLIFTTVKDLGNLTFVQNLLIKLGW